MPPTVTNWVPGETGTNHPRRRNTRLNSQQRHARLGPQQPRNRIKAQQPVGQRGVGHGQIGAGGQRRIAVGAAQAPRERGPLGNRRQALRLQHQPIDHGKAAPAGKSRAIWLLRHRGSSHILQATG